MRQIFAFNGDADGLCALQQLRLAEPGTASAELVTGVKRDIALLARVRAGAGDRLTVLDVSLDVNRQGLLALLAAGVAVRYFDHHFAGEIPQQGQLEVHIDPSPNVCTSVLVDRALGGKYQRWSVVGLFGDSLTDEGRALAAVAGLPPDATEQLKELGVALNYNDYGESVADLHVPPVELAAEMLPYADPLEFAASSSTFRRVADGYREDMDKARRLEPMRKVAGAIVYLLPDAAWCRRASGTLANDLAKANLGSAVAIVSHKTNGGLLVSIRVPAASPTSAEVFCRQFPTGGGRRTAAGINDLPSAELDRFAALFEAQFRVSQRRD